MTTFTQPKAQYLALYGFRTAPFGLSPDTEFFYPSPTHMSAGKILSHAIANGEGFMVLTGRAGLGKTLLLKRILEGLDKRKLPILILSPAVDAKGLLQLLLGEIGLEYNEQTSAAQLLQIFQNHVLTMAEQDRELFIIVDEAQNMPLKTLEQLRMLSNLETGKRKLMQILLIGQTGLENLLNNPKLGQLAQRIVVQEKLQPLNLIEVTRYVEYRLKRAGGEDIQLSPSACRLLHSASRGTPRLINRIMDRTLLLASLDSTRELSKRHVKTAISTMKDITKNSARTRAFIKPAALATAAIILVIIAYFFLPDDLKVFSQMTVHDNNQALLQQHAMTNFAHIAPHTPVATSAQGIRS
ncbi:ExeA family protein [Desulforhopalus sp. 52FAK]